MSFIFQQGLGLPAHQLTDHQPGMAVLYAPCLGIFVELHTCGDRVLISRPGSSGYTSHHIPEEGGFDNIINPFTAIEHQAETAVDGFADTNTTAIMESH